MKKNYKARLLYVVIFIFYAPQASTKITDFALGAGLIDQHIGKVQTSSSGGKNKFSYRPFLQAQIQYNLSDNFFLLPELALIMPGDARDDKISKTSYWGLLALGYQYEKFIFRGALGISFTYITSDGGTQELRNGLGTDSFPLPEGASTTKNVISNFGVEYLINTEWSFRTEASIFNLISSKRRSLSYTLSGHYHFGEKLWK